MREEYLYRAVVENPDLAAYWLDCEGVFRYVSPAAEKLFGYAADEILGRGFEDFTYPEDIPYARVAFQGVLSGNAMPLELRVLSKSGGVPWVRIAASPYYSDGKLAGVVGSITDISEHKRVQSALFDVSELHRQVFASSSEGLAILDRDLRYIAWNPALEKMAGRQTGEVKGKLPWELYPILLQYGVPDKLRMVLQGEHIDFPPRQVFSQPVDNGGWISVRYHPLRGSCASIVGVIVTVRDVSELYRKTQELKALARKLTREKQYLEREIRGNQNFDEIVGHSTILRHVLDDVERVAKTDSTVLVLGETGTGKELVARAIHHQSGRSKHSFIKLNCSAIPTGLLESELFGHERGAFTGAITQKIGRLELADHGTLFLDEVGDIPLELQPKLLRVLQDQEFERLGSTKTIRVNVRLVAATNRNLAESIEQKLFRRDLYYRLNVFPVRLPPLRERREDIPLLVSHFVHMFARRMNKQIEQIPEETMAALLEWSWPGNVRELENFIERSVILSEGPWLDAPLAELESAPENHTDKLEEAGREYIVRVLKECRGVISGPQGAAVRLGLKRTTLQSKMQRFGITRRDYDDLRTK